ncbi:MAG: LysE family translocator [Pseudomonadota bacterium]
MTPDQLLALAGFAVAAAWTPGPNNVMLAASGATYGWRRTLPHAMGVALGFPVMVFAIALGLGEMFEAAPALRFGLAWLGAAVMLWLAWRIGTATPRAKRTAASGPDATSHELAQAASGRPLNFIEAAAFQWVNPKAWVMSIGVSATYVSGAAPITEALIVAAVFMLVGLTSSQAWTTAGAAIGSLLGKGARLRIFNAVMGLLIALSALWLVVDV